MKNWKQAKEWLDELWHSTIADGPLQSALEQHLMIFKKAQNIVLSAKKGYKITYIG